MTAAVGKGDRGEECRCPKIRRTSGARRKEKLAKRVASVAGMLTLARVMPTQLRIPSENGKYLLTARSDAASAPLNRLVTRPNPHTINTRKAKKKKKKKEQQHIP